MKITRDGFGFWSCSDEHLCDICVKSCKTASKCVSCNSFVAKGESDEGKERKDLGIRTK